ncbi:hypothetical protein [Stieleria neptunia]|nr:hypothetical protein [Stieleria neptunia]
MSRFDRCAVDSAEEDKPTPVDANADNRRQSCRPVDSDSRFPTVIPIEYIGKQRRWLGLSSWPTA